MRRFFDSLFDGVEADLPRSRQTSHGSPQSLASIRDSGAKGSDEPMPNKKNETPPPSSRSLSSIHSRKRLAPSFRTRTCSKFALTNARIFREFATRKCDQFRSLKKNHSILKKNHSILRLKQFKK